MLLMRTLLCRQAVITFVQIYVHYLTGTFCGRIAFSYVMSDCTHVQTTCDLFSFVLIISSLSSPRCTCPQLITYSGFYDSNLTFVGLEGVHTVRSMIQLPLSATTPSPPNWLVWSASAPRATLTATSWKPSTAHASLQCVRQH